MSIRNRYKVLYAIIAALLLTTAVSAADRISAREFNSGVSIFKRGEFELAAEIFKKILDESSGAERIDEVKYWYAECQERMKAYDRALEYYTKIVTDHPQSKFLPRAMFGAGYAAYRLNQHQEAAKFFSEAAKKDDVTIAGESLIMAAYSFNQLKQTSDAEAVLRDLLDRPGIEEKYKLDARFELGRLLIRQNQDTPALEMLTPVTQNKDHPRQAEAMLAIGDMLHERGRFRESLSWYEKVTSNDKSTADMKSRAVWNSAWSELTLGRDEGAENKFKVVVEMENVSPEIKGDAWLRLAILSRRGGKEGTAEWRARKAVEIAETSNLPRLLDDANLFMAESAYLKNRHDTALDILGKIRQTESYPYLQLKGQVYFDGRRYSEAQGFFEKAVAAAPDAAARNLSLFDLAQTLFNLKSYESLLAVAEKIQNPAASLEVKLDELYAKVYMETGKFKEAAEKYAAAAKRKTDTDGVAEALYFTALAYHRGGMNEEARKALDRLFAKDPPPSSYRTGAAVLLGDILVLLGQPGEGLKRYRQAAEESQEADVLYLAYTHLIEHLIKTGRRDPADTAGRLEAVVAAEEFAGRLTDSRTYLFIAESLYGAKEYSEVLRYTRKAIAAPALDEGARAKAIFYEMAVNYELKTYKASAESYRQLAKYMESRPAADPMAEEVVFWNCRIAPHLGSPDDSAVVAPRQAYLGYLEKYPSGKYAQEAKFSLGLLAFDAGDLASSEKTFMEILGGRSADAAVAESNELFANTVYNLASVKIAGKDYGGAKSLLTALEKNPSIAGDPGYRYKRGYVEMQLGQNIIAEEWFAGLLKDTDATRSALDKAVLTLSDLYYRSDRPADLFRLIETQLMPVKDQEARAHVCFLGAMVHFNKEQYDSAARLFEQVKNTPDTALQADAMLKFGDCHYNQKNYRKALSAYEAAERKYPNTRWAHEAAFARGLCKIRLNLQTEAAADFEEFLKANPSSSMAHSVALEAAKVYTSLGLLDRAMEKIAFIETSKEGPFKQEASLLRVKLAEKKNDVEEIYKEASRHVKSFGAEGEVLLVAVQAAVAAGKYDETFKLLDGAPTEKFKPEISARLDFYKAESLRLQGKGVAEDIYQRLIGAADSEVRLSAGYRYAGALVARGQGAQAMEVLKPVLKEATGFKFYEESILFGITASKNSNLNDQAVWMYETYGDRLSASKDRMLATEAYYSACLALKENEKALKAIDRLMKLDPAARRRTELKLSEASLLEDLGRVDHAIQRYEALGADAGADADLRGQAVDRRIQIEINRGAAGRPYLMSYLSGSPDDKRGSIVAEKLLADAVAEKRHKDVVRIVETMGEKFSKVPMSARYRSALALLELSDTPGALEEFKILADPKSTDTFYRAWSALKLGEVRFFAGRLLEAEPHVKLSWVERVHLTPDAQVSAYKMLAGMYLDADDTPGLAFLAGEPEPAGVGDEARLVKGLAAYRSGRFTQAVDFLKPVASKEVRAKWAYANALRLSGDTAAAISVLDELAGTRGTAAAAAQLEIARLYDRAGQSKEALIHYYNVIDQYEEDENREVEPEAMLGVVQMNARTGKLDKAMETAELLAKKYPKSPSAAEARKIMKKYKK